MSDEQKIKSDLESRITDKKPEDFFVSPDFPGEHYKNLQHYPSGLEEVTYWEPKYTVLAEGRPMGTMFHEVGSRGITYPEEVGFDSDSFQQMAKEANKIPYEVQEQARLKLKELNCLGHSLTSGHGEDQKVAGLISIMKGGLWPEENMSEPWWGTFGKSGTGAIAGDFFTGMAAVIAGDYERSKDEYLHPTNRGDESRFISPNSLIFVVPSEAFRNALRKQLDIDITMPLDDRKKMKQFREEVLSGIVTLEEVAQGKIEEAIFNKRFYKRIISAVFNTEELGQKIEEADLHLYQLESFLKFYAPSALWQTWKEKVAEGEEGLSEDDFIGVVEEMLDQAEQEIIVALRTETGDPERHDHYLYKDEDSLGEELKLIRLLKNSLTKER